MTTESFIIDSMIDCDQSFFLGNDLKVLARKPCIWRGAFHYLLATSPIHVHCKHLWNLKRFLLNKRHKRFFPVIFLDWYKPRSKPRAAHPELWYRT